MLRIESPTTCRPRAYYSSIGIDFTGIDIFNCEAWSGHAMPRERLPASLLRHSACTSTSSVRHRHHRPGRLRRLLPSSLHLARTRFIQPITRDPPGSCDVHRRVLCASFSSNRAAGLLLCRLVRLQHRRPCVRFAVASTSPSPVHRRLYCVLFAAPSVCTRSSSC